jgi:glutamine synthetase
MGGDRATLYNDMTKSNEILREKIDAIPDDIIEASGYIVEELIPAMSATRELADRAEKRCNREYWPFPTYGEVIYTHHTDGF